MTAKLLPLRSIVSSCGSVEKPSGGSLLSRLRDNTNVCSESSSPRNESCSMDVIWLPLRSAKSTYNHTCAVRDAAHQTIISTMQPTQESQLLQMTNGARRHFDQLVERQHQLPQRSLQADERVVGNVGEQILCNLQSVQTFAANMATFRR